MLKRLIVGKGPIFVKIPIVLSRLLQEPVSHLRGVGPEKATLLRNELGVETIEDMLQHYPYRYVDKTLIRPIREAMMMQDHVLVSGVLSPFNYEGAGRKRRLVAYLQDNTGSLELIWFQGHRMIQEVIIPGQQYIVFGKINRFGKKATLVHPEMEARKPDNPANPLTFEPVYSSTEALMKRGLDYRGIKRIMHVLMSQLTELDVPEIIPKAIISELRLPGRLESLKNIHFPTGESPLIAARKRLKFEELFLIQLEILMLKKHQQSTLAGFNFDTVGDYFNNFYNNHLPFNLTEAQKRVVREIRKDMGSGRQMNRLLQGDVGSGKTVVALLIMLLALDNGFQSCLLAPTEILAQQHYEGLKELVGPMGIRIGFLSGSVTGKTRKTILDMLKHGEIHFLIGTHAILEPGVVFKNLGLAITDEQHRFGVAQRAALWKKSNPYPPHVLVMTATPIPRTLALTIYGDLDVSIIDELPPGRKPITTELWYENKRLRLFGFMKEQIKLGRQIYVVYPLIQESEKLDLLNLEQGMAFLEKEFPKPEYQISVVHGKMNSADKDFEMQRFLKKETQIMVATTVIEVGVNVPNASVMVIENSERFGLSQLHQLRGRVGRGADQSYCILMTSGKLSPEAKIRLQTMCQTNDGFQIADVDLKLRGPGDMEGTRQSGIQALKIADLREDGPILHVARVVAARLLDMDENLTFPEHLALRQHLTLRKRMNRIWSRIS